MLGLAGVMTSASSALAAPGITATPHIPQTRVPPGAPDCGPANDGQVIDIGGLHFRCEFSDGQWQWTFFIPCIGAPSGAQYARKATSARC
jgi:hypothetical protein